MQVGIHQIVIYPSVAVGTRRRRATAARGSLSVPQTQSATCRPGMWRSCTGIGSNKAVGDFAGRRRGSTSLWLEEAAAEPTSDLIHNPSLLRSQQSILRQAREQSCSA